MAKDDMRNEIEELRAQVTQLTAERKAKEKEPPRASSGQAAENESVTQGSDTTAPAEDEAGAAEPEAADLTSQFQELIDTIDEELKEASPVTVLVVFALGVLVGRLLPR